MVENKARGRFWLHNSTPGVYFSIAERPRKAEVKDVGLTRLIMV